MRLGLFCFVLFFYTVSAIGQGGSLEESLKQAVLREFPKGSRATVERIRTVTEKNTGSWVIHTLDPRPSVGLVSFQAMNPQGKALSGTAYVKVWTRIAVASSPIQHKEGFSEKNVKFEERELGAIAARSFFFDPESIGSKRAKGYIRSGQVLGLNNTETPFEVETGKLVELVSRKGPLTIAAKVRAIDTGRIGDTIRVENMSSKRVLRARVMASDTVEVN